jgi:hypothetical protein
VLQRHRPLPPCVGRQIGVGDVEAAISHTIPFECGRRRCVGDPRAEAHFFLVKVPVPEFLMNFQG